MSIKDLYDVRKIRGKDTYPWLLKRHYALRIPSISYAYGLFKDNILVGVCTFGFCPGKEFNKGKFIFGNDYQIETLELNRLCIKDGMEKNVASFFIRKSLKLLPSPRCIVSFADPNHNHQGYIYQATNWLYTGKSSAMTEYYDTKKNENIHCRHIYETYNIENIKDLPPHVIRKKQKPKHRYIMFIGNKGQRRRMRKEMKLDILPYPKGKNKRYDTSSKIQIQKSLF